MHSLLQGFMWTIGGLAALFTIIFLLTILRTALRNPWAKLSHKKLIKLFDVARARCLDKQHFEDVKRIDDVLNLLRHDVPLTRRLFRGYELKARTKLKTDYKGGMKFRKTYRVELKEPQTTEPA